jgi:cysteine-rich repeat protein
LCSGLFACGPELVPQDTAGSTTRPGDTDTDTENETETDTDTSAGTDLPDEVSCGDGIVGPGESCDDANLADDDGCTSACEIGPCGFEWITRIPSVTVDVFAGMQRIDGELELLSQRISPVPRLTQMTHVFADGELGAIDDLSDLLGNELPWTAVRLPDGDRVLASRAEPLAHVRRFDPDGTLIWAIEEPTSYAVKLAAGPGGQLAMAVENGVTDSDYDVRVHGLDASDGGIVWSHDLGGQVADNGYSLDYVNELVIDEAGRVYVGFSEYVDWSTNVPTLASFSDAGDLLWTVRLLELPNERVLITALTLGVDQTLYATVQSYEGYFESYLLALEPETGSIEWMFDYDDLPNDRVWKSTRSVAASSERVLVTGYWSQLEGEQQIVHAYALGFDLDGERVCIGEHHTDDTWVPLAITAGEQGEFYLGGQVSQPLDDAWDLFAARVR